MKKVININFQGRVIPIEESAYDMLKQYVESLRVFFANEEGRDEIINDIEGRIAELFGESLKKGSTCITVDDVKNIIKSMGRPEDFEAEEAHVKTQLEAGSTAREQKTYSSNAGRRLFRDENHKILGGVCSGVANYFSIDPVILRVLSVVFIGITFIPYLILWVVVPSTSSVVIGSQRKRLFRDPETKIIAGVCSGLAQYFTVQLWIPRILFLIPFFSFVFRWGHWGWWDFPHFLSFSFSPGAVFIYIILWLVLPEAKSAADKLEMKGEKVDLNNIKSTIQGDLEGFKERAQTFGSELKEKAQEFGENIGSAGKRFSAEAGPVAKRAGNGLGSVITIIVKIFVYFFLGCILFSIVAALFTVGIVFTGLLPAYSYVLDEGYQKILSWGTLILFIWVPVIATVTWIIRRLARKKGNRGIIRLSFLTLWILGLICFVNLLVSLINEFRYRNYPVEQPVTLSNPRVDKLEIKTAAFGRYYTSSWLRMEPFASFDEDTVYVRNVRLRIIKSTTDSFQVTMVKMGNGSSKSKAEQIVSNINYNIVQNDTLLILQKGIAVTRKDKFRNQQVIVTVAVPVGKRIYINDNVEWGNNVSVNIGRNDDYWDWENNMESVSLNWRHNVEYIMTSTGLERMDKKETDDDNQNETDDVEQLQKSKEQIRKSIEEKQKELDRMKKELNNNDSTYRYKPASTEGGGNGGKNTETPPQPTAAKSKKDNISTMTSFLSFID